MRTRFDNDVGAHLNKYHISIDSNILSYMLFQVLDIKISKESLLTAKLEFDDQIQKFRLQTSQELSADQINKLLSYLEMTRENYHDGEDFIIEANVFFNKIQQDLFDLILRLSLGSPSQLKPFQIASRPYFFHQSATDFHAKFDSTNSNCHSTLFQPDRKSQLLNMQEINSSDIRHNLKVSNI